MNSVMSTVNNVKSTLLKLVSHPLLNHPIVKGCITLVLTFLLFITSMAYLPVLCFAYAFIKTVLYSHVVKNNNKDEIQKGHAELVNNWLVYCLAYVSYSVMNTLLGGLFLVIGRLVTTVFVLDLTFLRNNKDSTMSIVLFQMMYKLIEKYRKHPVLVQTVATIDDFENNVYPSKRLGFYNMVMEFISRWFSKDENKSASATTDQDQDNDEDDVLIQSSSNLKPKHEEQIVEEKFAKLVNVDDEEVNNDDEPSQEEEHLKRKKSSKKNKKRKKKVSKEGSKDSSNNSIVESRPKTPEPDFDPLSTSQVLDDEEDDRELDEDD